ncbi:hypothetical protein HRI_003248700 [Hibiscus trionum]|uniref:AT-hook motif nuclear-localized protein n=1 Tax=Hibiscus trionum TaxID=183268 RepID=A0A9W7MD19_HIBTR|nr:hypothetical protein HRI_003248700 [Hibiscus trionum]
METISGVTVIGAEAPSAYHMAPWTENAGQITGGLLAVDVPPVSVGLASSTEKKKRGKPRKYGPDGTIARALSPMPISSSVPPGTGEFSGGGKQGRGRGIVYQIRHHKGMEMGNLGDEGYPLEESKFENGGNVTLGQPNSSGRASSFRTQNSATDINISLPAI